MMYDSNIFAHVMTLIGSVDLLNVNNVSKAP